jgi:cytochrome c oxidase assembly protein subunit 15
MHQLSTLRRLALAAMLLAFCVAVLGAYVRLTNAGLGCPDWPGCYGHVSPASAAAAGAGSVDAPLQVDKAWREMIHRYAATTLGLLIVTMAVLSFRWRRHGGVPLALPASLVGLVILQGLLGMWTVTLLLKPLIVTLHLVFGFITLAMLWWLWRTLRQRSSGSWSGAPAVHVGGMYTALSRAAPRTLRRAALAGLLALIVQIMLGGWTSTNYAAVACPDLPKCQGAWWPKADFADGFVLWRGLGINYEGGVLNHPARVAIHFIHRLGAVAATAALLFAAFLTLRMRQEVHCRWAATAVLCALGLQLLIGLSMVHWGFPLWLATAHNAGAALLLLATLALHRALRRV